MFGNRVQLRDIQVLENEREKGVGVVHEMGMKRRGMDTFFLKSHKRVWRPVGQADLYTSVLCRRLVRLNMISTVVRHVPSVLRMMP